MKSYPLGSLELPDCPAIQRAERFGGGYEELKDEEEDDHENV
nr:MAG TPA: hypothetical protein [Caudoviricetes sp.]